MQRIERREFIKSVGAVAALSVAARSGRAANDVIRVGVAGIRSRGQSHIDGLEKLDGVEVVALCDVDKSVLGARAERLEKATNRKIKRYVDVRQLVEDQNIDVITTATPNHWHALIGVWAMQAGKDVYVEKPCSHNVFEGRQLVAAARKHERICQHGTQSRSDTSVRAAIQFLKEGGIGKVHTALGLCYKWRPSIAGSGDRLKLAAGESLASRLDWNLWQGPAAERTFSSDYVHYNWHWFWDYGNGDIGNQGVHEMDIARWGLGVGDLPTRIQSAGGRFGYKDTAETPNTLFSSFDYGDKQLQFEVRGLPTNDVKGVKVGNIFYGSEGYLVLRGGWKTFYGKDEKPGETSESYLKKHQFARGGNHFENFIQAVRSRNPKDLNAEIADGHLSSALCHLGNIAYRLGRTVTFDPKTETFGSDAAANQLLARKYRSPFVVPRV